jgi:hypothetical protein
MNGSSYPSLIAPSNSYFFNSPIDRMNEWLTSSLCHNRDKQHCHSHTPIDYACILYYYQILATQKKKYG